jgi:hypothetical protein
LQRRGDQSPPTVLATHAHRTDDVLVDTSDRLGRRPVPQVRTTESPGVVERMEVIESRRRGNSTAAFTAEALTSRLLALHQRR